MDFNDLGHHTEKQFINIQKRFTVHEQIFSDKMPNSFLLHVKRCQTYSFNLYDTHTTLLRPIEFARNYNILNINGKNSQNPNQIFDILYAYFVFNHWVALYLRNFRLNAISIINSDYADFASSLLGEALFESRHFLEKIIIDHNSNEFREVKRVTNYILSKIHLFRELKHLQICSNELDEFSSNLKNISKRNCLKTIFVKVLK